MTDDTTHRDHDEMILSLLREQPTHVVNGFPFPADDTPPLAASDEPPADFDGGTREPAPPPSDPEAEHNSWLLDAIEKYGEEASDE